MCTALKEDFVPYLDMIIPLLLKTANQEVEAPSEGETSRIRMRPAMKLVGRPVFLYIPRYFHKKRRDYSYEYHKIHSSQRDRI